MATQGKVEGLMELFGVGDLCVTPQAGMADRVVELVGRVTAADGELVGRIRSALPAARSLSAMNFASLGDVVPLPDAVPAL
jgi:hypothetical protein